MADCPCGSGGHPRKCALHPWGFEAHCGRLDFEAALDDVEDKELRARFADALKRIDAAKRQQLEAIKARAPMRGCLRCHRCTECRLREQGG